MSQNVVHAKIFVFATPFRPYDAKPPLLGLIVPHVRSLETESETGQVYL